MYQMLSFISNILYLVKKIAKIKHPENEKATDYLHHAHHFIFEHGANQQILLFRQP